MNCPREVLEVETRIISTSRFAYSIVLMIFAVKIVTY
jgi:hypothetical protein